jgi:hypothetical protein
MNRKTSRRAALGAALLCLAFLAIFASAASAAGLDRSYGSEGAVAAELPTTVSPALQLRQFAIAPDGSVYGLAQSYTCGFDTCTTTSFLVRYAVSGAVDTGFGSGGAVELPAASGGYVLGVDGSGRAVVAGLANGSVTVRRYTPIGGPDVGFGTDGASLLPCACGEPQAYEPQAWVMAGGRGRLLVEVQSQEREEVNPIGGTVTLLRLRPDGLPDRSFGRDGTTAIALGARGRPGKGSVAPNGALILGASGCCTGSGPYLLRVSARGRVDKKFARTAARSLQRLRRSGELARFVALVPRSKGRLDILGNDPLKGGFDFRLKGDGSAAKFGRHGLQKLPFQVEAGIAGSAGALFVVGAHVEERVYPVPYFAYRVLGNGRIDPAFGSEGVPVPLHGSGLTLARLNGGKALVADAGYVECRQGCPATPGFARFVEGSARG